MATVEATQRKKVGVQNNLIVGLNHISIFVRDVDEATRFWMDIFEAEPYRDFPPKQLFHVKLSGVVLAFFAAMVVVISYLIVQRKVRKRQEAFADQLEQTLPLMAGSLRAGFSVTQAIDAVARESDEPTASEFRRVVVETRLGRDTDEALGALAERVESEDFRWVVQAIEIHRQVGGDLSEVLDNVYATIRDRNGVRRQIQALSGEGKLSAIILFVLPFGTARSEEHTSELQSH